MVSLNPHRSAHRYSPWYMISVMLILFLFGCSRNPCYVVNEPDAVSTAVPQTGQPLHQMLVPDNWNGNLVVYAHGFLPTIVPLQIPPESEWFSAMATSAGFAFATTSYPSNGMAVVEGLADLVDLVEEFKTAHSETRKVLLIAVSMGGLIAAQAAERYPETFDGVLAMCGIYGSFIAEVNHIGTFRVIFDYFFPDLLPGNAVTVPEEMMYEWETVYVPQVAAALMNPSNEDLVRQLLSVTRIPVEEGNSEAMIGTIISTLSMHTFTTEDVVNRIGGNPFGNRFMRYYGSDDDRALNAGVERFRADPSALWEVSRKFSTTGKILMPVITMHAHGDNIVPIRQQCLYRIKVMFARKTALYTGIPVQGYGHCTFSQQQMNDAFSRLVTTVIGVTPQLSMEGAAATCKFCR